jgi:steroid delta-isomerase-like uncharacterized protein
MPVAMTGEEYKAKVRRAIEEVWNKNDWEASKDTYADDMVVYTPSHPQPLRGREPGMKELHTALHIAHPDFHIDITKMVVEGRDVALLWNVSGTNTGPHFGMPPTGKKFLSSEATFIQFNEEGKISEIRFYMNVMDILVQLGVMPPGPPPRIMIAIIGFTQWLGGLFGGKSR